MARKKNLTIQMHNIINDLLRIGESKHDAKLIYKEYCKENNLPWNPSKSPFIHSTGTAENYRQVVTEFSAWLKVNEPDIWSTKDLSKIDKEIGYKYLKERESNNLSAWTIKKDMSALNKVLDLGLNGKEGNLKDRRLTDITRSRTAKAHDQSYNANNYKDQIEMSKAFGVRRESILGGEFQIKETSLFKKDNEIYISVVEKGGKYREAPCLKSYHEIIDSKYNINERESFSKSEFVSYYMSDDSDFLFDKYTAKIDNHAFRSEYATNLYEEIASDILDNGDSVDNDYCGYDSSILREVSNALGHNRINVIVNNYLR